MLETMFLDCYLLYIFLYYLIKIDGNRSYNLLGVYSENNNKSVVLNYFNNKKYTNIQSAENCKGFSETIRQISKFNNHTCLLCTEKSAITSCSLLRQDGIKQVRDRSDKLDPSFINWLAGVIDGDGNFDIRNIKSKLVLKAIRIKLHNRDVRILTRIQNELHMGAVWLGTPLLCLKLSNSGDVLKLMIPSYSRKAISGWSNYSCMVITHKMSENEMDYRGSKSVTGLNIPTLQKPGTVKEQRVDGSWCIRTRAMHLRCTLMGFERNYQVKILSNQINRKIIRFYTSKVVQCVINPDYLQINPWFLTGFTFIFFVLKNKKKKKTIEKNSKKKRREKKFRRGLFFNYNT